MPGISDLVLGTDADSHTRKGGRTKAGHYRLETIVAAGAPLTPDPDPTQWESKIIADHQNSPRRFDTVLSDETSGGAAAQVHPRLWLRKQGLDRTDRDPARERLGLRRSDRSASPSRQLVKNHKATVVACPLVLRTRVAQSDNQPHAETLFFRLALLDHLGLGWTFSRGPGIGARRDAGRDHRVTIGNDLETFAQLEVGDLDVSPQPETADID